MSSLIERVRSAVTIDFETEPIRPRPAYPPKPVSVSIKYGSEKPRFYSWGHPTGNNSTFQKAKAEVAKAWLSGRPLMFQNGLFDLEVAYVHMKKPEVETSRILDTIPMMFLLDPHAPDYHLKESCERLLKWKSEERDVVIDWLMEHQPVPGVKLSRSRNSDNYAGAYICLAPGDVVEPYCNGDVDRTYALGLYCAKKLEARAKKTPRGEKTLLDALERELAMLPVVMRMEQHGVRVNTKALKKDIDTYEHWVKKVERWICKKLKAAVNLDSGQDLANALIEAGIVERGAFPRTPTGKLSTAKDTLEAIIPDKQLVAALRWRGATNTCLKTFLRPWYAQAKANKGRIYVRWNSIRREYDGGARTGRLSSSPNLQNIPKEFKALFREHENNKEKKLKLPVSPIPRLPLTPEVRKYILADKGHVLIDRDFASQELRVLGYFEDDRIAAAFAEFPDLDLHQRVADELNITRREAKTVHFAILYGVGNGHLAELLDISVDEAKHIKARYFDRYPSVGELIADIKAASKLGKPVRTWGGREYFCEPPKLIHGRLWDFAYKLLNYLIQGSSADLTKECMIELHSFFRSMDVWLLASIHDELVISAPKAKVQAVMALVRNVMNADRLDQIPMRSSGKVGTNFATMKECA